MPTGNASPRLGNSTRGRRGPKMSYGADQDEELAELQRRFMALEDEARTTMEKTMASPRGAANKAGRERAAQASVRADNEAELAKLDEQITQLRRKHDDLAHANLEKRRELDKLNDRLQDLSREASLPSAEDNPIMKEIRELEARLNRAVTKYEDAQEVRRTYEQIVKRLKEERIGFNNQLEARESTMRAKEADYEELLLMSHDANQSKEMAKQAPDRPRPRSLPLPHTHRPRPTYPATPTASLHLSQELAKFEQVVSDERKLREKELAERRALVAKKQVRAPPPTPPFPSTPNRSNSALSATASPPLPLAPRPTHPVLTHRPHGARAGDQRRARAAREGASRVDDRSLLGARLDTQRERRRPRLRSAAARHH